jgi:hypothetical protein
VTNCERCAAAESEAKRLREHLYELQRHYSSEHFALQESMRNLKIERMRNAGAFADRELLQSRGETVRERISELKARLLKYEPVEDRVCDGFFLQGA